MEINGERSENEQSGKANTTNAVTRRFSTMFNYESDKAFAKKGKL